MNNNFDPSTPEWAKPMITSLAQKYGVNTFVLSSQIRNESGFNPTARGYNRDKYGNVISTDRGIAQINDYWHPEISNKQADDPQWAMDWMARTMAEKFKRHGDWGKALSEYNTGNPRDGFSNGYVNKIMGGMKQATGQSSNVQQPSSKGGPIIWAQPDKIPNLYEKEVGNPNLLEQVRRLISPRSSPQPRVVSPLPSVSIPQSSSIRGSAPTGKAYAPPGQTGAFNPFRETV